MDITFRGQHVTITEDVRDHASAHLEKLERHLPVVDHAVVDVRREAKGDEGRYIVQVTVNANGTVLRAEERNYDMAAAVDACTAVLDRQAKRFKERHLLRSERRVGKDKRLPIAPDAEESRRLPPGTEIIEGNVVRTKRFNMKPMTEAEAIEQMDYLGHTFFLFFDADREELAVLYRRTDGDYGMILQDNE